MSEHSVGRLFPAGRHVWRFDGGALLRGLDKRFTDKMRIEFKIPEDPLHAVAKGTGVALKNINRFSFLIR